MYKRSIFLSGLIILVLFSYSQEPALEDTLDGSRSGIHAPGIFGKITDSKSGEVIPAASVQVFVYREGRTVRGTADSLIASMLAKDNGSFGFINVVAPDSFRITVSALGYSDYDQTIARGDNPDDHHIELGNLKMIGSNDLLSSVTVVATKPSLEMGIDRKVFNVDKSLTSTGGTGIDILRNIPSVSVDIDGNISLRNSPPQIFVDGRPTILTLDQIPADDIEKIELITNPSAKFDASSAGGIINVVLKKNRRFGLNGIASAGVGSPQLLNGNFSLNLRQGKFNFFGTVSYNRQGGVAKSESHRQNKDDGTITDYFDQISETKRRRRFTNVRFGADYFIDDHNTVSFTQGFVKGVFSSLENQDQRYLDQSEQLTQSGNRISDAHSGFHRSSSTLNYTRDFIKPGRKLTADITYNTGTGFNGTSISNYFYDPAGNELDPNFVRNRNDNNNNQFTAQADFEDPISENAKLEMGIRSFRQNNGTIYNSYSVDGSLETKLPLSTNVRYSESVQAAYVTYSNKWKKIGYQVGVRAEYSKFDGTLVDSAKHFGYQLPLDIGSVFDGLYPSLYLTREVGEGKEIQLNFSRRVRRPDFWELNPQIDINDPLNISQGNPRLSPEYTNSIELNYNQKFEKGNFLGVIYFRNNVKDITRFSDTITTEQYQQLSNAAIDANAILNTYINAQYTNRLGAEITVNQTIGNLELIPNINLQYRKVKAQSGNTDLSNQGFNWEGKLIINYKFGDGINLLKNTSLQFINNYESPKVIPQGRLRQEFASDFALKKQFLKKNAASVTLAVNDIFNSDTWGQIYDTESFYQNSYRRWNVRNFRVTFSYRFGSSDFDLFGNKKKSQSQDE